MSKSRGNFLDPQRRGRGARYRRRPLRGAARGRLRPRHRGVLGYVRAPLQRRPRERLRQPPQPDRLDGQPLPRRRAAGAAPGRRRVAGAQRGPAALPALPRARSRLPAARGAGRALWSFVGAANRYVDAEQPWVLAKAAKAGDAAAAARLRRRPRRPARGVPRHRARGRAVHARRPRPVSSASWARVPVRADGNGGPPLLDELAWGAQRPRQAPRLSRSRSSPASTSKPHPLDALPRWATVAYDRT